MIPLIIDTDPGHDDALAILLASAFPEVFRILAITTVGGNQTIEKVTRNALSVVEFLRLKVPVARGASGPLLGKLLTSAQGHGESGMDGPQLPEPKTGVVAEGAVALMARLVSQSPEPVTLVAIGPLTNVALLVSAFPELKPNIKQISLMGGALAVGNATATAEFNILVDPEAAQIVFLSGIPIVMSGLDVTHKAYMTDGEIERLHKGGKASVLAGELLDFYAKAGKTFGFVNSALHDPCAVACLIDPELFQSRQCHVEVETRGALTRGMTVADLRPLPEGRANVKVLTDVNRESFLALMGEALRRWDAALATA